MKKRLYAGRTVPALAFALVIALVAGACAGSSGGAAAAVAGGMLPVITTRYR